MHERALVNGHFCIDILFFQPHDGHFVLQSLTGSLCLYATLCLISFSLDDLTICCPALLRSQCYDLWLFLTCCQVMFQASLISSPNMSPPSLLTARSLKIFLSCHRSVQECCYSLGCCYCMVNNRLLEKSCQFIKEEVVEMKSNFFEHLSSDAKWTPW